MTRRREGQSLSKLLGEACPRCLGTGLIPRGETLGVEARRRARQMALENVGAGVLIIAHPETACAILGEEGDWLADLENETGARIRLRVEEDRAERRRQFRTHSALHSARARPDSGRPDDAQPALAGLSAPVAPLRHSQRNTRRDRALCPKPEVAPCSSPSRKSGAISHAEKSRRRNSVRIGFVLCLDEFVRALDEFVHRADKFILRRQVVSGKNESGKGRRKHRIRGLDSKNERFFDVAVRRFTVRAVGRVPRTDD